MADGNLNYLDLARRMDERGEMLPLVEVVSRLNPFVQDIVWKEGRLVTGDKFSRRTGLPGISKRAFNQGTPATKSRGDMVEEPCGMFSGLSKLDVSEAQLGGNELAVRLEEDEAFIESFGNVLEAEMFYGSQDVDARGFNGLFPRFEDPAGPAGQQLIDGDSDDATGDNNRTSIAIVGWGDKTVHGIVPKGKPGGLQRTDMGKQLVRDDAGLEFPGYVTSYEWTPGLAVKHYEFVARIANIHLEAMADAESPFLWEKLIEASSRIKSLDQVQGRIYMHRRLFALLRIQALRGVKNATLSYEHLDGSKRLVPHFDGMPIRITDGLSLAEKKIVGIP